MQPMPCSDAAGRAQAWIKGEEINKVDIWSLMTDELRDHLQVIEQKIDGLGARMSKGDPLHDKECSDSGSSSTGGCEASRTLEVSVPRVLDSGPPPPPPRCDLRASTHVPAVAWADGRPARPQTAPAGRRSAANCVIGSPQPPSIAPPTPAAAPHASRGVREEELASDLGPKTPGCIPEDEQRTANEPAKSSKTMSLKPESSTKAMTARLSSADCKQYGQLRPWLDLSPSDDEDTLARKKSGLKSLQRLQSWHTQLSEFVSDRLDEVQDTWQWKVVKGMHFQLLTSTMIVLNVVLIGFMADDRLQNRVSGNENSEAWEWVEIFFACFFAVELFCRLLVEKVLFVVGPEWKWNLFDSGLVLFSSADLILSKATDVGLSDVTAARVMRFVRFARIIRIARAVRAFHSLRVVVFGIFQSISSLFWCFIVVGLIIYMFALLFLYGVTEHVTSMNPDDPLTVELLKYFGSVPRACNSLFMTISGGVDWEAVVSPLEEIHWIYQPTFTLYVFLMSIGVLNVVMGAFVTATAEIAKTDRELIVKNEITQMQTYTQKIRAFFEEADKDKSGMLSWAEFRDHLKVPKVQAYFQALELDVSQAHVVFKLLDRDGSNEVSVDEFIAGCLRLKGEAKALEVNMLLWENTRLFNRLTDLFEVLSADEGKAKPAESATAVKPTTPQS